jgi:hypothetical protein
MSEKPKKIDVYESRRFEKALAKLSDIQLKTVENEVDLIIDNPTIGTQKKGDLSHLRVHKFKMNHQETLLGYSWLEDKMSEENRKLHCNFLIIRISASKLRKMTLMLNRWDLL